MRDLTMHTAHVNITQSINVLILQHNEFSSAFIVSKLYNIQTALRFELHADRYLTDIAWEHN